MTRSDSAKAAVMALLSAALSTPAVAEGLALGKGADAKSKAEAAELSYLSDAAKGSSMAVAAALIWAPQATFSGSGGTLQWDVAAGINKNTIAGDKRVEKHVLAFGGRHVYDFSSQDQALSRASFERRRNRLTDGDESAFSAISAFNLHKLKFFGPRLQLKMFPFVGAYHTSTRGNTGAGALNGSFGGAITGLDLAIDLASGMSRWATLDVSYRRHFERQASGDFKSKDYDFGTVDLRFPFTISGGEAAIALGHTRGTDRIGGTPWKRQTLLKFSLKFGSA
jgi:hypothetical protein